MDKELEGWTTIKDTWKTSSIAILPESVKDFVVSLSSEFGISISEWGAEFLPDARAEVGVTSWDAAFMSLVFARRFGWSETRIPSAQLKGDQGKITASTKRELISVLDFLMEVSRQQYDIKILTSLLIYVIKQGKPVIRQQVLKFPALRDTPQVIIYFHACCKLWSSSRLSELANSVSLTQILFELAVTDVWSAVRKSAQSSLSIVSAFWTLDDLQTFWQQLRSVTSPPQLLTSKRSVPIRTTRSGSALMAPLSPSSR